jgi:hypothetical protein
MNQLVPIIGDRPRALVATAGERASRFFEFFTAEIGNPNPRRAYVRGHARQASPRPGLV